MTEQRSAAKVYVLVEWDGTEGDFAVMGAYKTQEAADAKREAAENRTRRDVTYYVEECFLNA